MGKPKAVKWISLIAMAVRLRIPYSQAWKLAITGEVRAEQRGSRWFVYEQDVFKLAKPKTAPAQSAAV